MYRDPYNCKINTHVKVDIENLDEMICDEMKSPNRDRHKILRMKEQKTIQGLYNNELGYMYGKYRSPW